jgi:hypothetical protein
VAVIPVIPRNPSCHGPHGGRNNLQVTFDAIKRATAELQDVAWRIARISDMKRRDQKKGKIDLSHLLFVLDAI